MQKTDTTNDKIRVVYDRQCPACHLYCELLQSNAAEHAREVAGAPEVELLDAREDSELMQRITHLGLDIDEGMVVEIDKELFYGADAIHALTAVESRRGLFRWVTRLLFARRRFARFFYPWLRRVRNLLLKLLGKHRINNLKLPGRDKF